jgi:hypothetical protein
MPFHPFDLSDTLSAEALTVRGLLRKVNTQLGAHPERHEAILGGPHARDAIREMLPWLSELELVNEWRAWAAKQLEFATPFPDVSPPNLLRDVVLQASSEPGLVHILDGKQSMWVSQVCALWGIVRSGRASDIHGVDHELLKCVFIVTYRHVGPVRFADCDLFNELAEPLRKSRWDVTNESRLARREALDEFDPLFQALRDRPINPHASFIVTAFDELDAAVEELRCDNPTLSEAGAVHAVMRCLLDFNLLTVKVLGPRIDGLKYVTGESSVLSADRSRQRRSR